MVVRSKKLLLISALKRYPVPRKSYRFHVRQRLIVNSNKKYLITSELLQFTHDLWHYLLSLKYVYVVTNAIVYVSDTLFTCLHSLRKEGFRWFSKACIPRALALYILWRRMKTGITHSWWFSTSLVERARCLKYYLHKASTSVLNTVNLPTIAPDPDFPKKAFSAQPQFPTTGPSMATFCCLPSRQLCRVFNISEVWSPHLKSSWHSQNSHKPLNLPTLSQLSQLTPRWAGNCHWNTLTVISPTSSFVTHGHLERTSHDKAWGVTERHRSNTSLQ